MGYKHTVICGDYVNANATTVTNSNSDKIRVFKFQVISISNDGNTYFFYPHKDVVTVEGNCTVDPFTIPSDGTTEFSIVLRNIQSDITINVKAYKKEKSTIPVIFTLKNCKYIYNGTPYTDFSVNIIRFENIGDSNNLTIVADDGYCFTPNITGSNVKSKVGVSAGFNPIIGQELEPNSGCYGSARLNIYVDQYYTGDNGSITIEANQFVPSDPDPDPDPTPDPDPDPTPDPEPDTPYTLTINTTNCYLNGSVSIVYNNKVYDMAYEYGMSVPAGEFVLAFKTNNGYHFRDYPQADVVMGGQDITRTGVQFTYLKGNYSTFVLTFNLTADTTIDVVAEAGGGGEPTDGFTLTFNEGEFNYSGYTQPIEKGKDYNIREVMPNEGYFFEKIEITRDGRTMEFSTNPSTKRDITINNVQSDVFINITTTSLDDESNTFTIEYGLVNVKSSNNKARVIKYSSYDTELTAIEGTINYVSVQMEETEEIPEGDINAEQVEPKKKWIDITSSVYVNGVIHIAEVSGNVRIYAGATPTLNFGWIDEDESRIPPLPQTRSVNSASNELQEVCNMVIPNPYMYTYREIIGFISAAFCCNATYGSGKITSTTGNVPFLRFKTLYNYGTTNQNFGTVEKKHYFDFTHEESTFSVKKVVMNAENGESYEKSESEAITDKYVMSLQLPIATQNIVDYVYKKIVTDYVAHNGKNFTQIGYNLGFIGDPQLEYGDVIQVKDAYYPDKYTHTVMVYNYKVSYSGGIKGEMSGMKMKESNLVKDEQTAKLENKMVVVRNELTQQETNLTQIVQDIVTNKDLATRTYVDTVRDETKLFLTKQIGAPTDGNFDAVGVYIYIENEDKKLQDQIDDLKEEIKQLRNLLNGGGTTE